MGVATITKEYFATVAHNGWHLLEFCLLLLNQFSVTLNG